MRRFLFLLPLFVLVFALACGDSTPVAVEEATPEVGPPNMGVVEHLQYWSCPFSADRFALEIQAAEACFLS